MTTNPAAEAEVKAVLEAWTAATRENRRDDILRNHADDLVIFDVLLPLRYDSAAAYRAGWDDWQPDTRGGMVFELEDLRIHTGSDVAFAYGNLRCGGTLADGRTFSDLVRATFCLCRRDGRWVIQHQHVSKPFGRAG